MNSVLSNDGIKRKSINKIPDKAKEKEKKNSLFF